MGPWLGLGHQPKNQKIASTFSVWGETIPDAAYQICGCFSLPKTCFLERFVTNLFNIKKIDQKVQKKICLLVFFIKHPKKTTPVRVARWLRVKISVGRIHAIHFRLFGIHQSGVQKKYFFISIFISLHSAAQNLSIAGSDNFF